jgi:hypothetical protein
VVGDYTWRAGWFGNNNGNGHQETTVPVTIHVALGTAAPEDLSSLPAAGLRISPNPVSSTGTLHFTAGPQAGPVRLTVVDASGRLVRLLAEGDFAPGVHDVTWDGVDDGGQPAVSGTYYAVLFSSGERVVRPVLLLR